MSGWVEVSGSVRGVGAVALRRARAAACFPRRSRIASAGRRSCRRHLSLQLAPQATVVSRGCGLGAACRPAGAAGANGPADEADFGLIGRAWRPQRAMGARKGALRGNRGHVPAPERSGGGPRQAPGAPEATSCSEVSARAKSLQGCGRGLPNWLDLWFELWGVAGRLPGRPAVVNPHQRRQRLRSQWLARSIPSTSSRRAPRAAEVPYLEYARTPIAFPGRRRPGALCPAAGPPICLPCYEAASVWSLRRPLRGVRRA